MTTEPNRKARRARITSRLGVFLVLAAFSWAAEGASALAPGVGGPKTTVVIFSDRPMAESIWTTLFRLMRREAAVQALTRPELDADPQLVRGVDVVPGALMENPIVVKLHGDCRPPAGVHVFPSDAPLGWVRREEGHISPFVQVDCTRVAQVIAQRLGWMSSDEKSAAMGGAIARVIVHEWIHIAEQSARHTHEGISKRAFGGADLVPDQQTASRRASEPAGRP